MWQKKLLTHCTSTLVLGFLFYAPPFSWPATHLSQVVVPASDPVITCGPFRFRVAGVTLEKTALGFLPENMHRDERLLFVEIELLSGSRGKFMDLNVQLRNTIGREFPAIIQVSQGMIKMLCQVTRAGVTSTYRPEEQNITWAYLVPNSLLDPHLWFPTGERVDLAPLLK